MPRIVALISARASAIVCVLTRAMLAFTPASQGELKLYVQEVLALIASLGKLS